MLSIVPIELPIVSVELLKMEYILPSGSCLLRFHPLFFKRSIQDRVKSHSFGISIVQHWFDWHIALSL